MCPLNVRDVEAVEALILGGWDSYLCLYYILEAEAPLLSAASTSLLNVPHTRNEIKIQFEETVGESFGVSQHLSLILSEHRRVGLTEGHCHASDGVHVRTAWRQLIKSQMKTVVG